MRGQGLELRRLGVVLALMLGVSTYAGRIRADEEAERLFQDARTAMNEKRFDAACALFEVALARDPAEGTRVNLAICEAARGHLVRARELLMAADTNLAGRDVPEDDERRALVRRELAGVERRIGKIAIETDPAGGAVEIDGKPIAAGSRGEPALVDPGSHQVTLEDPAGPVEQTVVVKEGETVRIRLTARKSAPPVPPPPPPSSGPHPSGWVVGSFAVGALVAGIVTGALGLAEKGDIDRYCEDPFPGQDICTRQEGVDAAARGRNYAIASTVSFAGAGVLGSISLGLLLGLNDDAPAPAASMFQLTGAF
ncbi:MAG: PEGA domain-containing protein [Polyangiaceae bacterium]|nr:PEGA domain-containing protein [Polyangiaceae bacterium]